jgi:hypothetical protein
MSEQERRVGENEAIFRAVNEEVRGLGATLSSTLDAMRIVCECGDAGCVEHVLVRPGDYAGVREDPTRFIVVPGHEITETEHVLERHDGYLVVQKDPGLPARIARATEPDA